MFLAEFYKEINAGHMAALTCGLRIETNDGSFEVD